MPAQLRQRSNTILGRLRRGCPPRQKVQILFLPLDTEIGLRLKLFRRWQTWLVFFPMHAIDCAARAAAADADKQIAACRMNRERRRGETVIAFGNNERLELFRGARLET